MQDPIKPRPVGYDARPIYRLEADIRLLRLNDQFWPQAGLSLVAIPRSNFFRLFQYQNPLVECPMLCGVSTLLAVTCLRTSTNLGASGITLSKRFERR
jgi:hypothetical protein